MSFSKSKSKRFNEILSCAPPVGKYDVTMQQKVAAASFEKSDRFKVPKEPQNGNSTLHSSSSMDSLLFEKTPIKKLFGTEIKNSMKGGKSITPCHPDINRKISDLQKEIRHLLQERTEQDKLLNSKQLLSVENSDLKNVITEVQEDLKNAKEFLKTLSQENEQEASRQRMESEQTISNLQQQLTNADLEIKTLKEHITSSEKRLENEVVRADEAATRADDAVVKADDAVNQVTTLTEKLEMTENMMNENLKALSTKYQLLEEDYTECQRDRQQENEQLRFELEAVYSTSSEIEAERDSLREGNRELMDSLEKEREVGIRLQEQLMTAERVIETTNEQHQEYKEQMENDLLVLNEAKNSLLILSGELTEKVKSLEEENQLLHKDLSRHAETFGEITREKTVLLNKMSDLSIQKQNLLESTEKLIKDSEIQQEQFKQLHEHSEKLTKEKELALESKLEQEKEMSQQIHNVEDELKRVKQEFAKRLVATQTKCSSKEVEVERLSHRVESLEDTLQTTANERHHLQQLLDEKEQEKTALNDKITQQERNHLSWQTLYENLEEKVAPFKEQLDQFELERKFMLSKSSQAQSEIQKLSQDYAKLLGHQNSKQKIQHVQKLKEENLALKQEVTKLREQNMKYMRQLKGAGEKNPSKKRFNPSEAFKNAKENTLPLGPHN